MPPAIKEGRATTDLETEWIRCATNPGHFIDSHCQILDNVFGQIPFHLYPFQWAICRDFLGFWGNVILKPRQMGISWLTAAMALWLGNFYCHKNILIISIKDKVAKRFLEKVRFMYTNLSPGLRAGITNGNEYKGEVGTASVIELANGSRIESIPTSENAGRSENVALLIVDEAAHIQHFEKIWASAYHTLSTGGQAMILSTPNGIGNPYHLSLIHI